MLRRLLLSFGALALALVVVSGYGLREYTRPGLNTAAVTVILPRGAGVAAIADRLAAAGVVRHSLLLQGAAVLAGDARRLKAGEYRFPAGVSLADVLIMLRDGRTVVHHFTVPEGMLVAEVMQLLQTADGLDGALPEPPAEGSLLPETYNYSYGDSRAALLTRMQVAMRAELARLWATRQPDLQLHTPEQAVILASIVEKETALPAERPHIAGVFLNRLRLGMRLQSDPTVIYGVTHGRSVLGRELTRADLASDTPYNTYRIDGLPPTPIANPGRAALAAVLQPLKTDDLYFVADGNGGHAFAATLSEHDRNVRRWRAREPSSAPADGN